MIYKEKTGVRGGTSVRFSVSIFHCGVVLEVPNQFRWHLAPYQVSGSNAGRKIPYIGRIQNRPWRPRPVGNKRTAELELTRCNFEKFRQLLKKQRRLVANVPV